MNVPKVLIIGAHGQIARVATRVVLERTNAELTLYLRRAERLQRLRDNERVRVVEGDALDEETLERAMSGQDVVYANVSGDMGPQANVIVRTMEKLGLKRLIFISSMGIYDEVPNESFHDALRPYREAADVIEASRLDYTILRPAWLNDRDEVDYGTTRKGEPFENPEGVVSRRSVADLVVKLAMTPHHEIRQSLRVHKPQLRRIGDGSRALEGPSNASDMTATPLRWPTPELNHPQVDCRMQWAPDRRPALGRPAPEEEGGRARPAGFRRSEVVARH